MPIVKIAALIDSVTERVGRTSAWLALVMVLLTALIVLMRYAFREGSISLQESVIYINALIFVLGAAYTLKEQGHVRVDIFYRKLGDRGQAVIDSLGYIIFLIPTMLYIIYASWDYVAISWQIREGSAETSGLPFVYLLKTSIIVLPALLFVQGVSELSKSLQKLRESKS